MAHQAQLFAFLLSNYTPFLELETLEVRLINRTTSLPSRYVAKPHGFRKFISIPLGDFSRIKADF